MIRWILFVFLVLYIVVPMLMPVIFSFSVFWQDILPQGFTLRWYEAILTRPANYEALLVSLTVASSAVLLNVLITVPAAYALNRMASKWGQRLREGAMILPLIFPPLVVGTALLQAFTRPPLALTGTLWMVIIAHTILGFPFMFRIVLAAFQTIDERTLSEAAASLGANLWQRMRYVLIPNVLPGILSGALLVFAISMGEFEVTSMVAGFTAQTLPLRLFQQIRNDMRVASAITAFLIYVSFLSFMLMSYLGARMRRLRAL